MKPFTKNLSLGNVGPTVLDLQRALEQLHYGDFVPTGFFGEKTKNAVINFQKRNNIQPAVGNFGSKTRAKLNSYLFPRSEILHAVAVSLLGSDASPLDRADDEYGCADTVNMIHLEAFGQEIGGLTQTSEMIKYLRTNTDRFVEVASIDDCKAGDIIISPTEYPRVGHVGIMFDNKIIMSNSSSTGLWTKNYTVDSWRKRYADTLKLKIQVYRLK